MKTTRNLLFSAALLLCGLIPSPTVSAANQPSPASKPGTLQVQINIPPNWRPMIEDRVSEAFASYIIDVFRRQGYKGDIAEVRSFEEPSPRCCLLMINLTEWRMNHIGNIDCTFTANIQTEKASRHLGVFSGMSFRWMSGPGRFGLADAFEDAAEDAIRQLYDAIARTELVPGLQKR
jgi:hypothetical protein